MADNQDTLEERPRGGTASDNLGPLGEDTSADSFMLMRSYFDQQFSTLKRDLREEVHASSTDTLRRFKDSKSHDFKYRGNRQQFSFNTDIIQELDILSDSVRHGERRQTILDSLKDVRSKLCRRNKLIKLADKSPAGWQTVDEYISDDLASDSEDDKRIRRAEKRAMDKKKPRMRKQPSATVSSAHAPSLVVDSSNAGLVSGTIANFRQPRRNMPFIQCFACGGWGHTRPECPAKLQMPGSSSAVRGFCGLPWTRGVERSGALVPVKLQQQQQQQPPADK